MAARRKTARGRTEIDSVPIPELKGMKVVPARVTKSRNAYVLVQGRTRRQIPLGPLTPPSELDALVGEPVSAVMSRTTKDEVVAIGTWPTPEHPRVKLRKVLCYVPAEATLRRVRGAYRDAILDDLVRQGAITDELADTFRR